jgi:hypothetical protein
MTVSAKLSAVFEASQVGTNDYGEKPYAVDMLIAPFRAQGV